MLRRLLHSLPRPPPPPTPPIIPSHVLILRPFSFSSDVSMKFIRDRGLDHAVEREKNLRPALSLKNLIKSEPSKSLPLSLIVQNKDRLRIPFRPIDFIRNYPSMFEEFYPGNVRVMPHVSLTEEAMGLDADERILYESDGFRRSAADRVLRLLMLCRKYEFPLRLIDDRLKWDLGLPDDYLDTLVPEFPHYFQVKNNGSSEGLLELVCWDSELAVSVMERRAMKGGSGYAKGMPIVFPMHFSKEFVMDKKLKKSINEWQKLPYVSPYENVSSLLQPKSEESDKWAVSVLHELLHIFVHKKCERDSILAVGEYLGIRSRFKRALADHPGIFYHSSKIGTYTMVLKEAYKRDSLIEKHPLMELRNKYIHLMNTVKEVQKSKNEQNGTKNQQANEVKRSDVVENKEEDQNEERHSDFEASDSDDDDEEVMDKVRSQKASPKTIVRRRARTSREMEIDSSRSRRRRPLITEKHRKELPLATEMNDKPRLRRLPLLTEKAF